MDVDSSPAGATNASPVEPPATQNPVSASTQAVTDKTAPKMGAKPTVPPRSKLPPPIFLSKGANFLEVSADCTHPVSYIRPRGGQKLKAIIRGILTDFPVEEIQADLCDQGFPVHRLCRRDGSPLWLVLAVLSKTEEAKTIFRNLNREHTANYRKCPKAPKFTLQNRPNSNRPKNKPAAPPRYLINFLDLAGRKSIPPVATSRPASTPSNPWVKTKPILPPRLASGPPREAYRRAPPVPPPAPATAGTSSFGDDIQTVMVILRAVKSSEISDFARDIRACHNVEEKLSVLVSGLIKNVPELGKCMSECDTALIQETYLKPNRPKVCSIAGYVQLRTDRIHGRKGGTALYYRRSLHCGPVNIPPLTNMEATGCRLAMTGHSTLVIVSVYLPSPKRLLRHDLRAPFALGDAVILFGDFNCKNIRWGCPSNNYNGIKLDELEDRFDLGIIAPSTSTCFSNVVSHRPSTINIALTKVVLNFNSIEALHGLTSDHRPVMLKMGPPDGGRSNPTRQWSRNASERFRHPRIVDREYLPDILELIKAKNAALRRASAYPTPEYRSRARALQREVKTRVQEFRNEGWSDLTKEIKTCHKAFWKVTKALKIEGYSIETQCSHASPPYNIAHINRIEEKVLQKTSLEPKDDLTPVSLSEVQTLVKSFNTRKVPGLDGIHKPGKPRVLPASYRPIILLSGLGKLFEKILKTRLSDHLLGKGLIIDEQFGFRPAHSCSQQILRLVEYVSEGFKTKHNTVAVFFDVAKAFDRQIDSLLLDMSVLTRPDVLSEQEFLKAPSSPPCCTPRTQSIYRDRRLVSNSRYSRTIPRSFTEVGIGTPDLLSSASRGPLMS
ncbi:RNA-directed DNA polymerase from mobile element jockey [Eumeta japonica]|uniref:RNA-directed DNA polymerase from mobile element jockey n=1 Tax=Eumeta variegata TaxID=151549 RepID=A0A4C1TEW3_EUMVA|nr:RNA-directed DNA polymerase from mobile element jockey [Eumeta japonica]